MPTDANKSSWVEVIGSWPNGAALTQEQRFAIFCLRQAGCVDPRPQLCQRNGAWCCSLCNNVEFDVKNAWRIRLSRPWSATTPGSVASYAVVEQRISR